MNIFEKVFWKARNNVEVLKTNIKKDIDVTLGCLKHREDPNDRIYGSFWPFPMKAESLHTDWSLANDVFRFNQNPFNICVFASGVLGASHQEGKRFSVRFAVQLARKLGMITGNGYSYVRAMREISTKYGRLPYEFMPDETSGMTWEQYSHYTITPQMLAEAAKWRSPNYLRITGERDLIDALDKGYVVYTSNIWYQGMNYPSAPDYYLNKTGIAVGGHAWGTYGYRTDAGAIKDEETLQTFSSLYGFNGKARIKDIIHNTDVLYIEEKIPGRTDLQRTLDTYTGLCVKALGDDKPAIYVIRDGQKIPFRNMDSFHKISNTFYSISENLLDQIPTGDLI